MRQAAVEPCAEIEDDAPPGLSEPAIEAACALLWAARDDIDQLSDLEGTGPVGLLERDWAHAMGAPYAVATSSGSSALTTALVACGVRAGDEVIVSAYGWPQTAGAVLSIGARPAFADIDPETFVMAPESARRLVARRTRAILVTHLFGHPADMDTLGQIAAAHGLCLIADAAQATGARWRGRPMGAFGDATAYSFGRGKLVCGGEGGMLVCRDRGIYERALLAGQHPLRCRREITDPNQRGEHSALAPTARLHPLIACIVRAELSLLEERRLRLRSNCLDLLRCLEGVDGVAAPVEAPGAEHGFHTFALTCTAARNGRVTREDLLATLRSHGVPAVAGPVATPLHWRVKHSTGERPRGRCPVAEERCARSEAVLVSRSRFTSLSKAAIQVYRRRFEAAAVAVRHMLDRRRKSPERPGPSPSVDGMLPPM
jgi:perosamine synthetase